MTAAAAASLAAQAQPGERAVPAHPDDLRFPSSTFAPPDPAGKRFELANGVPVLVIRDSSVPLVDVVLALPVGDRDEAPGEAGLASMTATMLRRGGAGDLSPDALDDEVDALGASIRAVGLWGRSVVALDCGVDALGRGLELLAAMVLEPRFDDQRLAQAKLALQVGLAGRDDDPRQLLEREWLRLVHGDDAPRAAQLTVEAVSAFSTDALAHFHRRHYGPEGAVFAVSGDVDPEWIVGRLDDLFGDWTPAGVATTRGTAAPWARSSTERNGPVAAARPGWWLLDRQGPQAAIALGHRGAAFDSWDDPDRWTLLLLVEILDGPGAVSRLRSRLQVGGGLTYRVITSFDMGPLPRGAAVGSAPVLASERQKAGAPAADPKVGERVRVLGDQGRRRSDGATGGGADDAEPNRDDTAGATGPAQTRQEPVGEFRVFFETSAESAAEATLAVLRELRRLRSDLVPPAELLTAKRSILARFPLLFDRAEAVAGRYAEDVLLGRPHEYWAVYRQRLGAVTANDIRRAARRFFDPDGVAALMTGDRTTVSSGPGAEALQRALGPPRSPELRQ